jgi:hypothetical protein
MQPRIIEPGQLFKRESSSMAILILAAEEAFEGYNLTIAYITSAGVTLAPMDTYMSHKTIEELEPIDNFKIIF